MAAYDVGNRCSERHSPTAACGVFEEICRIQALIRRFHRGNGRSAAAMARQLPLDSWTTRARRIGLSEYDSEHDPWKRSRVMRRGFLIDMDGVIYRGGELIPGADKFIQILLDRDIPFLFLTNNSQRTGTTSRRRSVAWGYPLTRNTCLPARWPRRFSCETKAGRYCLCHRRGWLITALTSQRFFDCGQVTGLRRRR